MRSVQGIGGVTSDSHIGRATRLALGEVGNSPPLRRRGGYGKVQCTLPSLESGSPCGEAHLSNQERWLWESAVHFAIAGKRKPLWRSTPLHQGEVAEWSKAPVSKTGIPQGIGSSNLPLSEIEQSEIEERSKALERFAWGFEQRSDAEQVCEAASWCPDRRHAAACRESRANLPL